MLNIPALLCVDVEPNDRQVAGDPDADWSATEPCLRCIEDFRAKVQATGVPVHINWFLRFDPQIAEAYGRADYAFERFRPWWERALAAGDGIGVHTHAWRKIKGQWISDHGDKKWIGHCVMESLKTFARCTGRPAAMFRFGDHFLSNEVVHRLDRAGVRYEMTLEPGIAAVPSIRHGEAATGSLPDYTGLPRHPYFPSRLDYRKPARLWPRRVRMIPMSTGCDHPDVLGGGQLYHLNLAVDHIFSQRISDRVLALPSTTHLGWVARTGDFAFPQYQPNFKANLDYLSGLGLRFVRPDEVWG